MKNEWVSLLAFLVMLPFAPAEADEVKFEPELDGVWDSTYGPIHWDKGWYGQEDHTIEIAETGWDAARRIFVISGNWGRVASKTYKGGFQFEFSSPTNFKGWWTQEGSDARVDWEGTFGRKALVEGPIPEEVPIPEPRKLEAPERAKFVPDLEIPWSSTYGDIHWTEGYYGEKEKTLTVMAHGWDSVLNKYVVRGTWGRLSNTDTYGLFEFEFADPKSFTGRWGGTELPMPYGWSGKLEEQ